MKYFYSIMASLALMPQAYAIDGNGSIDSPYLIKSAADWSEIAAMANADENPDNLAGKYAELSSDIDFGNENFTPIKSFAGSLDGKGHKLYGVKHEANTGYAGLIGVLEAEGAIANLTIEGTASAADQKNGTKVTVSAQYFGGLVGKLYGTLDNCVNAMSVTTTSAKGYAGGLAAYCYAGAKLIGCGNTGSVFAPIGSSAGRAGGIAAFAEKGVEFTRCYNEGTVGLSGTGAGNYAAGIVAEAYPCTFTDCVNEGEFEFDDAANQKSIAGILANAMSSNSETKKGAFVFRNCKNYSDINGLGLIAGILATYNGTYSTMEFYGCANYGDITVVSAKKNSGMTASGIVSKILSKDAVVSGCSN
ncbi:MAG: hypothetical protein NC548_59000, partial [Lachnospiraceae bacterium]|nr:hypothetical protein [Lachnospiraceae bacterium]